MSNEAAPMTREEIEEFAAIVKEGGKDDGHGALWQTEHIARACLPQRCPRGMVGSHQGVSSCKVNHPTPTPRCWHSWRRGGRRVCLSSTATTWPSVANLAVLLTFTCVAHP